MADDLESIQAAIASGDAQAAEQLLPLVYDELRRIARRQLRGEAGGNSLNTTGLVHEAYLRLNGSESHGPVNWNGQGHFLAAAAQSMRRILVDRARARAALKRGGDRRRLELLDLAQLPLEDVPDEVLELDEALARLSKIDPSKAELVSLKFFGGLTLKEAAAVLGLSMSTADRHWAFARSWLQSAMKGEI